MRRVGGGGLEISGGGGKIKGLLLRHLIHK